MSVGRFVSIQRVMTVNFLWRRLREAIERATGSTNGLVLRPHTGRPRAHHKTIISPYPGVHRQTGTEMFSVGDEKSWSTAAASAVSTACSMLAVQRQRKPCRRFVDVSSPRRGRQTTRHAVQIMLARRQLLSVSPRCKPACVLEASCIPANTT